MVPQLDLSQIRAVPNSPSHVSVQYTPGPTVQPVGSAVHLGGGSVAIVGWGGQPRLEAVATALFAAHVSRGGLWDVEDNGVDHEDGAIERAVELAHKLIIASAERMQKDGAEQQSQDS